LQDAFAFRFRSRGFYVTEDSQAPARYIDLLIELLRFEQVVALMAIKDKQLTRPKYLTLYILNKVL
jgi:hypothetical protein